MRLVVLMLLVLPSFSPAGELPSEAPESTAIASEKPATETAVAADEMQSGEKTAAAGVSSPGKADQATSAAVEGEGEEPGDTGEAAVVSDPIEPWNRLMYKFNDKLYFWVLKPVARGYSAVVPEQARVSVSNFFHHITTPIRLVNSLLQLDLKAAGAELARFTINTLAGTGGLFDPAKEYNLLMQDKDLGQTFGHYGVGNGFYIVWPFLGPSTARDSLGTLGDNFLDPVNYVTPFRNSLAIQSSKRINTTSLHIGDYEDLKEAALDPYISIRDAYIQNRNYKIKE